MDLLLLQLALVLAGAKLGGEVATRLKQPAVLGEILVGVLLGPSVLRIIPSFDVLHSVESFFTSGAGSVNGELFVTAQGLNVLAFLAELGVLLLLFMVGLESNLGELRRVGPSAILVGTYGVVFSLVAGAAASWTIAHWIDWVIAPSAVSQPNLLHIFIGATLTATSVGITARVLGDLGKIKSPEAQVILGAAVFDDVLGLIVLAIVGGLTVNPAGLSALSVAKVFILALGFFFGAILLGRLLGPRLIEAADRFFKSEYAHLAIAFVFMLIVSWLATLVGLAAIVGAFAAGLSLSASAHRHVVFDHMRPVASLFVGIFFVVLGIRVDLSHVDAHTTGLVVGLALGLAVVAVLGKLACGLGVIRIKADRFLVGVGMVPRGEVGFIFALFGLDHQLITNWQYSTLVLVVLLTTLVAPFWLKTLSGRFTAPATGATAPPEARIQEAIQT